MSSEVLVTDRMSLDIDTQTDYRKGAKTCVFRGINDQTKNSNFNYIGWLVGQTKKYKKVGLGLENVGLENIYFKNAS